MTARTKRQWPVLSAAVRDIATTGAAANNLAASLIGSRVLVKESVGGVHFSDEADSSILKVTILQRARPG